MLNDFLRAIKRASLEAVDASQPAEPLIGTVASISPISITINQRLILSSGNIIVLSSAVGVSEGDRVALIRFTGGQKFLLLGKIE